MKTVTCKDCMYFIRGKWHQSVGGGDQLSGECELLATVLKIDNIALWNLNNINVQDSFGCSLGKEIDL